LQGQGAPHCRNFIAVSGDFNGTAAFGIAIAARFNFKTNSFGATGSFPIKYASNRR
jgi:hypothetical protein